MHSTYGWHIHGEKGERLLGFSDHNIPLKFTSTGFMAYKSQSWHGTKALGTQKDPPANESIEQFWELRPQVRQ